MSDIRHWCQLFIIVFLVLARESRCRSRFIPTLLTLCSMSQERKPAEPKLATHSTDSLSCRMVTELLSRPPSVARKCINLYSFWSKRLTKTSWPALNLIAYAGKAEVTARRLLFEKYFVYTQRRNPFVYTVVRTQFVAKYYPRMSVTKSTLLLKNVNGY